MTGDFAGHLLGSVHEVITSEDGFEPGLGDGSWICTGGAHGAHAYNHHVIDLKTAKPIPEADIFVEGYEEKLAQILVDQIAKQNNVANNKELENIGFFSIDEIFPNGNFMVDLTGITYSFNEYEIAAYVVGATHVQLPYKEIRHLLREDSPISQLID